MGLTDKRLQQQLEAAVIGVNAALDLEKEPGHRLAVQSMHNLKMGNPEFAIKFYQKQFEESKGEPIDALLNIGALAYKDNTQLALDSFQRVVVLEPKNVSGWNLLGYLYFRVGQLDNAIDAYENILGFGNNEWVYGNLGLVHQFRGDLNKAVEYFEKSLAINEELGRTEGIAIQCANLGTEFQTSDLAKAIEYWERSRDLFQELGNLNQLQVLQKCIDDVSNSS